MTTIANIVTWQLTWFKDYLSKSYKRVVINGQYSDWGSIKTGVPQRSVLCQLLFLIFINDITNTTMHCNIRLFADDTCLILEDDNHNNTAEMVKSDLQRIDDLAKHVAF